MRHAQFKAGEDSGRKNAKIVLGRKGHLIAALSFPKLRPMTQNETLTSEPGSPARVRLASEADCPRLIPLINSAFAIETFLEGTRTDGERLAAMMQKGTILMAEDSSGRLLGCVYTEVRREPSGVRGYLGQLAVDPAHQGKGLARLIFQAAEDHLRRHGCEAVDITVLSLRPELPPIYRRFGYIETGMEEFKPSRPLKSGAECHCIVMSKQL
jgi:predicted N-acetyltransferase YhbS